MIQLFLPLSAITLREQKGILRKEKAAGEQMKYKFILCLCAKHLGPLNSSCQVDKVDGSSAWYKKG